ncbi:acyl carrier protein phosphodiesterase [Tunicatimonas pelagia]|uniref:acyl carrier protein phosphodiesterase n=1 Tax=Tunicatimonas pelagia TaxID=931531 RepID=UPI002665BCD8|nr:acyl carrier protein phosphodiesterase [Tunicatimonas pelagia]WKN43748.1 acyl carrier protein phosphodiesterase [Tunicatimonas pelagia]
MNLLAHFYLSRSSSPLIVGSFLGDFVKGKQYQKFDSPLAEGILFHREIDFFTDFHPIFLQSKHRLVDQHRHYAGVIVDIFYDHFLAKNWPEYCETSLKTFTQQIYQVLHEQQTLLPPKAQQMLHYMSQHNWLLYYAELEGIARTLKGMEKRSRYPNQMGSAIANLQQHYESFEQEFSDFFAAVNQHSQAWLDSI